HLPAPNLEVHTPEGAHAAVVLHQPGGADGGGIVRHVVVSFPPASVEKASARRVATSGVNKPWANNSIIGPMYGSSAAGSSGGSVTSTPRWRSRCSRSTNPPSVHATISTARSRGNRLSSTRPASPAEFSASSTSATKRSNSARDSSDGSTS